MIIIISRIKFCSTIITLMTQFDIKTSLFSAVTFISRSYIVQYVYIIKYIYALGLKINLYSCTRAIFIGHLLSFSFLVNKIFILQYKKEKGERKRREREIKNVIANIIYSTH